MVFSKSTPNIIFSEVSLVAPFQLILISVVFGTINLAHSKTDFLGKVPFVVRLILISCFCDRLKISSNSLYNKGSPIVEGIISLTPKLSASLNKSRTV